MPTPRFPYDLPGREALVKLIQENKPKWNVKSHTVTFGDPYFSPTVNTPGRTFIDVYLLDRAIWTVFRYKRLDIDLALPNDIRVPISGEVTPRAIVEEVNRAYNMTFGPMDLVMTDDVLVADDVSFQYRLRALDSSYVWYGTRIIEVTPPIEYTARLTESGETRETETGEIRILEQSADI